MSKPIQIVIEYQPDAPSQQQVMAHLPVEAAESRELFLQCQAILQRALVQMSLTPLPRKGVSVVMATGPLPPLAKGGRS